MLKAEVSPWKSHYRLAVSADGNPDADPDDIGATPATLAILARAGLQENLVHYDFNNWLEYKKISVSANRMWTGAIGGQTRFGFDRERFFDASSDPQGAVENLAVQISRSTAEDPLFLIVAGPMELIYQAMEKSDRDALSHVFLVSHSNYNEYQKPRLWQRNLDDVHRLNPDIPLIRIPDQNAELRTEPDYEPWHWLRDHSDPNLQWVYERMEVGLADISDSGMVTWLLGISGNDTRTTIEELKAFFGDGLVVSANLSGSESPPPPEGKDPIVNLPATESIFVEQGGRLIIEAESVPLTDSWILDAKESGYSGTGYIRYMPDEANVLHTPSRGVLTYKFRIVTPGKYRMSLKASNRGAPEFDAWTECWTLVGIDVAPWGNLRRTRHAISEKLFESGIGFTYATAHQNRGVLMRMEGAVSKPLYELSAGDHYFFIAGRSAGYRLDQIHFFKEGVDGFEDDSIPASPVVHDR